VWTDLPETKHAAFDDWDGYSPTALDEVEVFIAHKSNEGKLGEVRACWWCRTLDCYPVHEYNLVQHALVKEVAQKVQARQIPLVIEPLWSRTRTHDQPNFLTHSSLVFGSLSLLGLTTCLIYVEVRCTGKVISRSCLRT